MTSMIVKTIFKGQDLLTPIFKRQSAAAGKFGDKASKSFARASRSATRFGDIVRGVLTAGLIQRGLSGLVRGTKMVGEEFIDFDQALTRAGAKFPEAIKRGTDSFNKLGEVARKVGANTEFYTADAARGFDFLAMAGFNAEQAMATLPGITDLATTAGTDLARATSIAADTLGAFNLRTKDASQLQENLARVNDTMAATVTSSNVDMEQLFETMKFAGPVATGAGASIETFSTLVAKLADAGIKGSLSGTALRSAFIRLSSPVPKAQALLRKLGVAVTDSSGNMRDMFDVMQDLRKSTAKMGTAQRTAALNTIFGRRAVAGMSVILAASNDELRDYRQTLLDAGGASKRMAGDIRKSIGNRLLQLKSALIEIGFRFIEAFVGKGEDGLDRLIDAVRRFDVKPIVDGIKSVIDTMSVVVDGVKIFGKALWDLRDVIKTVAVVIGVAKAAQWAWNLAMLANPIGILIAVLGIAIVTIAVLANKWESAKATMILATLSLRDMILSAFEAIRDGVLSAINAIIRGINQIPGVNIPQFELPDNSAKLQRENELIKARNNLLAAAVKDDSDLQRRAIAARESRLGRERAEIYRQAPMAPDYQTEFAPVQQSVDPELVRQQMSFSGEINVRTDRPESTTFRGKTRGAPPIKTAVLGANP
jgi:TP901 family phage tail tape measure protein